MLVTVESTRGRQKIPVRNTAIHCSHAQQTAFQLYDTFKLTTERQRPRHFDLSSCFKDYNVSCDGEKERGKWGIDYMLASLLEQLDYMEETVKKFCPSVY